MAVSSCSGGRIEDEVMDAPSSRKEQVGPNSVVLVALVHAPTSVKRVREVPLSLHVPKFGGSSGVPGVRRGPDGGDDSVRPEPSDSSVGDLAQAEVGVGGRRCGDGEDVSLRRTQGNDRQERLPLSKQSREQADQSKSAQERMRDGEGCAPKGPRSAAPCRARRHLEPTLQDPHCPRTSSCRCRTRSAWPPVLRA